MSVDSAYDWPVESRDPDLDWSGGTSGPRFHRIVAYDYGVKRNILRSLARLARQVTVLPAEAPASEALALKPDGIFLSNGPALPSPAVRDRSGEGNHGLGYAGAWHLPGPPDSGSGLWCTHNEDEIWTPRSQSSHCGPGKRGSGHQQPESWLCGGRRKPAGLPAGDSSLAVRRNPAGPGAPQRARHRLPGPPGGQSGTPRSRLCLRTVRRIDRAT